MDPKKKFTLFKQSKHFCSVPWNHLEVWTDGSVYTCALGADQIGSIPTHSIEQIVSSTKLTDIRQTLLADTAHTNCQRCHSHQRDNYKYLRDLYNPMFKSADVDYENLQDFKLSGIDLHWGSTCNLKCITCWPEQSSAIAQEQGVPIVNVPTEQADQLIDFIVANQTSLKEIYLSGGEPTLIKHNLRLLRRLRTDLDFVIRINTNMTTGVDNAVITELRRFPNVLITVSADAMGERFNYIRRGADWSEFLHNLEQLQKLHFKWRVNSVFFVASALYLTDTHKFFMDRYGITDITINQVAMDHFQLQCRNLPAATKQQTTDKITAFREAHKNNTNLYGQLTNCLAELAREQDMSYADFFDGADQRAGTDWRRLFTELV
jgi:radical SAM protein with 4Fe4S-binding SPASM domain